MGDKKHPSVLFAYCGNKIDEVTHASVIGTSYWLSSKKGFQNEDGTPSIYHLNTSSPYIHTNRTDLLVLRDVLEGSGIRVGTHTPPLAGFPPEVRDVDLIFMFDWDMQWTKEDWWTLYEACMSNPEPAIYSGVYVRGDGNAMIHMPWTEDKASWYVEHEPPQGEEPIEVATVGMGFTMFKPSVLEKFPYPWFLRFLHDQDTQKPVGQYGEDVAFCLNAHDVGVKSYVHPQIQLRHYKRMVVHPNQAVAERQKAMMEEAERVKLEREAKKEKAA